MKTTIRKEWLLPLAWLAALAFSRFESALFASLNSPAMGIGLFVFLFIAIMVTAFAVVRHADALAELLGEPLGTLVLTLAVTVIEVSIIAEVMLAGADNPTMARDTMFSVIMIVMNGLVGFALLFGGLKHREQRYNLSGTNTFLAIILPLSVISLVLPAYTHATARASYSIGQSVMVGVSILGLYAVFLAVQTVRHRSYFDHPEPGLAAEAGGEHPGVHPAGGGPGKLAHSVLLIAYLVPVVLLAESISIPVEHSLTNLHLPSALGGFVIAALVLSPEAMGAIRAAMKNQLQRSINIFLGSVAATIGMTIPAILAISVIQHEPLVLGLDTANAVLLALTMAVSMITYSSGRTNVLLGAVHLVLFLTYLMLIFDEIPTEFM